MKLERSTYEILQILSISLTDKAHLRDLFDKTNFNPNRSLENLSTNIVIAGLTRNLLTVMDVSSGRS